MKLPARARTLGLVDQSTMTPLIDVVFLLLIFFICASTGPIREWLLPLDFSRGQTGAADATEAPLPLGEVWLRLRPQADGRTVVDVQGTVYDDWDQLQTVLLELAAAAVEIPVILQIHDDVPMGDVIRLQDLCRTAGFSNLNFATRPVSLSEPEPQ
jgi:biopolymer transport protein ExbD